jgi:hypothetical protein
LNNLAVDPASEDVEKILSCRLTEILKSTGDPRFVDDGKTFEQLSYTGRLTPK